MKKVFITGISGFAGKHLAEYLFKKGTYKISGTYYTEESLQVLEDIQDKITCIKADLTDVEQARAIIAAEKPDYIYHLAALTSPSESFHSPLQTMTSNIGMEINLLEAVREYKLFASRILIVSSADIYGIVGEKNLPIDENTPFHPTNPYAVSKLTQDYLGLQYALAYNLKIVRVRPFNHIGPYQSPQFVVSAFAKQIAEIEKEKTEPVLHVGNLEAKRDFTDVRDMVVGYHMILEQGAISEVYNIGSGKAYKIAQIVDMLLSLSSRKITVQVDEALLRPSDTPELICDNTKFVRKTGWKQHYTIEETLKTILDYWRKIV